MTARARSNTAQSQQGRFEPLQEELSSVSEYRAPIRSVRTTSTNLADPFARESHQAPTGYARPILNRTSTFEGPTQLRQEQQAPGSSQWIQRTTSETLANRHSTRTVDPYADSEVSSYGSYGRSSPERMTGDRSCSPATSHGSVASRRPSGTALNSSTTGLAKKAPPPPPPSRAKKPPPPPPPMKRSLMTATHV